MLLFLINLLLQTSGLYASDFNTVQVKRICIEQSKMSTSIEYCQRRAAVLRSMTTDDIYIVPICGTTYSSNCAQNGVELNTTIKYRKGINKFKVESNKFHFFHNGSEPTDSNQTFLVCKLYSKSFNNFSNDKLFIDTKCSEIKTEQRNYYFIEGSVSVGGAI